jgi:riboflavin kinase/FMN adenylyltransferase
MHPLSFTAPLIKGSGRGKSLGVATMNLDLKDVPKDLSEGIYACFALSDGKRYKAAMHYGPRPVFKDTPSCEVHLIDEMIKTAPKDVTVIVIERLRDIADFPSKEALMAQIADDIARARGILVKHESPDH